MHAAAFVRRRRRWGISTVGLTACLVAGLAGSARADIYKYTAPDGSVVYTDNLGEVPAEERAVYERKKAEQEARRRELEARIGKDELERREAEAAKAEAARNAQDESARQTREQEEDEIIAAGKQRRAAEDADHARWHDRLVKARKHLSELLADYKKTSREYNNLANRVSFSLLPGQAQKRDALRAKLKTLEPQIDAAIVEVEETIPEDARRAGVPPGWLRE